MNVLKSTSSLINSFKPKTFRKKHKSPKKRLSTIKSRSASRSKRSKSARSHSHSHSASYDNRLLASPTRRITRANKSITKKYKKLGIDEDSVNMLAKKVNSLDKSTKLAFTRTKKKGRSPSSPLVITVKNVDTGKKQEATIVKNLDTGKYEFLNI